MSLASFWTIARISTAVPRDTSFAHPFTPFITETLWGLLIGTDDPKQLLMVQRWPETA